MGYAGEILNACGSIKVDFSDAYVVAVSGDGPNICGHLLIYTSNNGGYYFHVAELRGYPRYMTEDGYKKYLKEAGKVELRRLSVRIPNPSGSLIRIESLLSEKWTWGAVPHNCVTFAEDVISAGGGTWASLSNCPAVSTADSLQYRIQLFLQRAEAEIYHLYGVPK